MKIVSLKICPFVQRVVALLEAKNIDYEVEYIGFRDRPQWFLDISANGRVPVLITDEGEALFESDAISEYLEEAYPALQPDISLIQKAQNRAWSYLASNHYLPQCSAQRSPDEEIFAERGGKLDKAFDVIEEQLGDTKFFSGDDMNMVDIAWLPLLHRAEIINRKTCYDFIGDRPKLKKWQQEILATGLAEKSVAPDFEEIFTGFYLSDETYLGQSYTSEGCTFDPGCDPDNCC